MSIYNDFIGTVQAGGLTNPYGLAAVAATGKHESGYSPGNAYGAWSDPAESGAPGTAGGILSWRAERLDAMRRFAADRGEDPRRPSPQTQAAFFLAEDPALVSRLNQAGSAEEAIGLMNGAWRFAGYDRAGGEAARRLATTRSILSGAEIQDGSGGGSRYTRDTASSGATMAYPSSRVGGLGGLGGMPDPEEEPAQGGLAGFLNEPGVGDVFRAMGMSMMSAPRNNPFALVPEILPGLQAQREKSEERKADRASLTAALLGLGMSPEEAAAYSRNPQAAQLILDRRREDEQRERNRQFARTLTGGGAYADASYGDPTMTDADPALSDPIMPSAGRTTTISGDTSMGAPLVDMPDVADVAGSTVPVSSPAAPTGNKTHVWGQSLYQEADRLRQVGMMAETAEQRAAVEYALDGVNANIKRYETWAERQGKAPDLEFQELPNGDYGYFDPSTRSFTTLGSAPKSAGAGGMIELPDGTRVMTGGANLTEGQSKDTVYSTRARGALEILDKTAGSLTDRGDRAADMVPFGLGREYFQSTDYQLAQQAGDEFLQAILRKDTGAAITGQEQALYGKTYLPELGDGPELLKQKQAARGRAVAAIEAGMPPSAIVAQELALRKSGGDTSAGADLSGYSDADLEAIANGQ